MCWSDNCNKLTKQRQNGSDAQQADSPRRYGRGGSGATPYPSSISSRGSYATRGRGFVEAAPTQSPFAPRGGVAGTPRGRGVPASASRGRGYTGNVSPSMSSGIMEAIGPGVNVTGRGGFQAIARPPSVLRGSSSRGGIPSIRGARGSPSPTVASRGRGGPSHTAASRGRGGVMSRGSGAGGFVPQGSLFEVRGTLVEEDKQAQRIANDALQQNLDAGLVRLPPELRYMVYNNCNGLALVNLRRVCQIL